MSKAQISKEKIMMRFFSYCSGDNIKLMQQHFKQYPDDIETLQIEQENQIFSLEAGIKFCFFHDKSAMLKVLLDFYISTRMPGHEAVKDSTDEWLEEENEKPKTSLDENSREYKVALHTLKYMLEEAYDEHEPSNLIIDTIADSLSKILHLKDCPLSERREIITKFINQEQNEIMSVVDDDEPIAEESEAEMTMIPRDAGIEQNKQDLLGEADDNS